MSYDIRLVNGDGTTATLSGLAPEGGTYVMGGTNSAVEALEQLCREHVPYFGNPPYDKEFGDDRVCACGHPYYRHFDTYEDMAPVGCKYCDCGSFQAPDSGTEA